MRHPHTPDVAVALLTGGADKPYAFGLATALLAKGVCLDLIAGDELDGPPFHNSETVRFLNLRGNQHPDANLATKVWRVLAYYARLIRYAATARPRVFHILWNNKFAVVDRTILMVYYRLLRKTIILTVHNVNAGKRDANDSLLNRLTLRAQYRLAHHLFVHTEKMKQELHCDFGVPASSITVIPFGINNAVPESNLTPAEARARLAIGGTERTLLFFGNIAPYKGLEYLVAAFTQLLATHRDYRLIIAGRPKDSERYWQTIREMLADIEPGRLVERIAFIPDEDTEIYFKAADVLILPYTEIFQSGVLFLSYSFGLPVVAADVGSLRQDVVEGETGFLFEPRDEAALASAIEMYFDSDLFKQLAATRQIIRVYANERYSWDKVGQTTCGVYQALLAVT